MRTKDQPQSRNKPHLLLSVLVMLSMFLVARVEPAQASTSIIYVDADSTCLGSCGGSWATAYPDLQSALAAAVSGDQIWVAEGVYYPDEGTGQTQDDVLALFTLVNGVPIYGGFAGNETLLQHRDPTVHLTILSGDIEQNDINSDGNFIAETTGDIQGNNALHVLQGSNKNSTAVLDGFIITAGFANSNFSWPNAGYGGGMININGSPTLSQLIFSGNYALVGGGMFSGPNPSTPGALVTTTPVLTDIIFTGNNASYGGGMMIDRSSATILTNITFRDNRAGWGGGFYNKLSDSLLTDLTFSENNVVYQGGGMFVESGDPSLTNVSFLGNYAPSGGGIFSQSGNLTLTGVTVSSNSAANGGGLYVISGTLNLIDSEITGNAASGSGGGFLNQGSMSLLRTDVLDNTAAGALGGGALNYSTLTVTDSTFDGNQNTANNGGAIFNWNPGRLTVTGSTFSNNSTVWAGGAIISFSNVPVNITNSTFFNNVAGAGGYALYLQYAGPNTIFNLTHVTFAGNGSGAGAALAGENGTTTNLQNTLIANNGDPNCGGAGFTDLGGNLQFPGSTCGASIPTADPLLGALSDNGGPTETMALLAGSPAIDNAIGAACPAVDQRGMARPQGAACDVGAYEANLPPVADAGGPYLSAIDTGLQFDGSGSSDPENDALSYTWDFGDSSTGTGPMPVHSYGEPGIYDVCLTVNDGWQDSQPSCTLAVVYDPAGGFVTGGGWIDSPAGAYQQDGTLSGKATFGFVSKYKKGADVPTGNTQFQFKAGDFTFHSESYQWLVVNQNDSNAQFKGSGMVNGALDSSGSPYKFMLWAGDGSPDTFRIKIWSEVDGVETVVYDNGTDQALGGGSIVVHKGK